MRRHATVTWGDLRSTWYACAGCQSLMVLPRPSDAVIQRVYENDYLSKRLQPHIGVDCRKRYAASYRPTVFREYELSLADLRVNPKTIRSVLDVGCADGVFLEYARMSFPKATRLVGTDISENLLTAAKKRGWTVFPSSALSSHSETYDLITLWDVIEHTKKPAELLRTLRPLLSARGMLVIQTPRVGHIAVAFAETWPHLLPVQHLSLASKEGMKALAEHSGFSVDAHTSFGANAPSELIPSQYKRAYDALAKQLDFGEVQLLRLSK